MSISAPEKADNILQGINKFISLDESETQKAYTYLKGLLDQLLSAMKDKDAMFNAYYKKIVWAGSYWDKLKVGNPDEYDVDIVMGIPNKYYNMEVHNRKGSPGFVSVKLIKKTVNPKPMKDLTNVTKNSENVNEDCIKWEKFIDSNRVLLQSKFRYWFEGVVLKGLNTFPKINENSWLINVPAGQSTGPCKVSTSKSGPAMTLIVSAENTFSVDLVPVIEMSSWPPPPFCKHIHQQELQNWFIVPKPKKNIKSDDGWRCSFLYQEKAVLHDTQNLKPVLRMIKKFRDRQNLPNISSYYIKTIFMWETLEHKNNQMFFKKSLIDLFLHMLSKLRDYFEKGNIPYLWNKQLNLLNEWDETTCKNIYGKVKNILLKIQRNINNEPSILFKILLTESEEQEYITGKKTQTTEQNNDALQPTVMDTIWNTVSFFKGLFFGNDRRQDSNPGVQ